MNVRPININSNVYSNQFKKNNITYLQNNKRINFTGNNQYKEIDKSIWPRAGIYDAFENFQSPYVTVTSRLNVTKLLKYTKEKGIKSSHAIIFLLGKVVNEIPEFRTRLLENGQIVKYNQVDPVFSVAVGEGKPFSTDSVEYDDSPQIYLKRLINKIEELKKGNGGDFNPNLLKERDNFFVSCEPNMDFSSLFLANIDNKDSKPLICWGKYSENKKKGFFKNTEMSVMLRVHHGFADGDHMSMFFENLQKYFNNPEKVFGEMMKSTLK